MEVEQGEGSMGGGVKKGEFFLWFFFCVGRGGKMTEVNMRRGEGPPFLHNNAFERGGEEERGN